jgi:hypothetical protein
MPTIIISFANENEAQTVIGKLVDAGAGEVRARVLNSTEPFSYNKTSSSAPIISPEMGSVEVRPTETPQVPEAQHPGADHEGSTSIPITGKGGQGIQVMIEYEAYYEETVQKILAGLRGDPSEQVGD